jgi:hypothetical protein
VTDLNLRDRADRPVLAVLALLAEQIGLARELQVLAEPSEQRGAVTVKVESSRRS